MRLRGDQDYSVLEMKPRLENYNLAVEKSRDFRKCYSLYNPNQRCKCNIEVSDIYIFCFGSSFIAPGSLCAWVTVCMEFSLCLCGVSLCSTQAFRPTSKIMPVIITMLISENEQMNHLSLIKPCHSTSFIQNKTQHTFRPCSLFIPTTDYDLELFISQNSSAQDIGYRSFTYCISSGLGFYMRLLPFPHKIEH